MMLINLHLVGVYRLLDSLISLLALPFTVF
jgi:hypothetical protein